MYLGEMRTLISLFALIFLAACSQETKETRHSSNTTTNKVEHRTDAEDSILVPVMNHFDSIMAEPFDLKDFKRAKRGSHSGVGTSTPESYKPDSNGVYIRFFLFAKRPEGLSTSEWFNGEVLTVYKFGDKVGFYGDTNEILIEIKSAYPDEDLGHLDIVGRSIEHVVQKYNHGASIDGEYAFMSSDNKILVMHLSENNIDWFRYVVLDHEIREDDGLPSHLKIYDTQKRPE